jgi:hypothetical protein
MNERIQLLMGQVLDEKFAGTWSVMDLQDLTKFADRFAELIVQECLDQCYNRGMNDELYAGQLKAAAYIEEHFGVEE